jgi:hypothetical protein
VKARAQWCRSRCEQRTHALELRLQTGHGALELRFPLALGRDDRRRRAAREVLVRELGARLGEVLPGLVDALGQTVGLGRGIDEAGHRHEHGELARERGCRLRRRIAVLE